MAFDILSHRREICAGPSAKKLDIGRINDDPTPVRLEVHGLLSDCNCPIGKRCDNCRETTSVWLLIAGTFNPDLHQRGFVFWGYINRDGAGETLRFAADAIGDERVTTDPDRSQLVFGWYTPYPGKGMRGWIAPSPHSLNELFLMFFNTSDLRRTFSVTKDGIENTELPLWRGRVPPLSPHILWGMFRRHDRVRLRLRHVERQIEGYGIFQIVGIELLSAEGRAMDSEPTDATTGEPQWTRFRIRFEFYLEDRVGDAHETYKNASVDVCEDGHWNYIWARLPDGNMVSWVHRNSQ